MEFYIPNSYENPLTARGRARTIAAFLLAQGDMAELSQAEMRRDVLVALMSPSAVNHWLNTQSWLEKTRKVGKVQLLRLTDAGLRACANSLAGGGTVPTDRQMVAEWVARLKTGAAGYGKKTFSPLENQEA